MHQYLTDEEDRLVSLNEDGVSWLARWRYYIT